MVSVENIKFMKRSVNPEKDVYIGRKCGSFEGSIWFNPYPVGDAYTRSQALKEYYRYICCRLVGSHVLREELNSITPIVFLTLKISLITSNIALLFNLFYTHP